jgi:uncharacterized protein (DUF433 family)
MSTVLETNLVRTPGICGGRLRIDGTRMTVNQIVTLHNQGLSDLQIVEQYPQRSLAEITRSSLGTTTTRKSSTANWPPKRRLKSKFAGKSRTYATRRCITK